MAKVAIFMFVFALLMAVAMRMVTGADAPGVAGAWNSMTDKVEGAFSPDGTVDQIRQAAAPAVTGMRGAGQAFASQASQAFDTTKQEAATWGDWFKNKIGAMNIFGSGSNGAPAPAPAA